MGIDVRGDLAQAVERYRKAAESGLAQDPLRKLAGTGYPPEQHALGMTYEYGWGSLKIEGEAAQWCRKSRRTGVSEYDLGRMLAAGGGVLKNETEAKEWFRRAVEKACWKDIRSRKLLTHLPRRLNNLSVSLRELHGHCFRLLFSCPARRTIRPSPINRWAAPILVWKLC